MFRSLVLAILLTASCAGPRQSSRPPATWEPQARAIAEGRDGALAVPASEAATLLWAGKSSGGPGSDLYYARSHDGADSFPSGIVVNGAPGEVKAHGESAPWIRIGPGQELLAAWEGNGDIRFARSVNFGRSFLPPVTLNDGPEKAHQSFLHMDSGADGTVAVAWLDFRNQGLAALYAAVSRDRGATWGLNVKVADAVCPCCRPAVLAAPGGVVHVIWRHVFPTFVRDLAVATSRDGGASWSAPVRVAVDDWVLDGCPHSGPSAVLQGNALAVAYYTGAGKVSSLRFCRSTDEGRTWSRPVDVHAGLADANHPFIVADGEDLWMIFQARDGSERGGWGPVRPWISRIAGGLVGAPSPLPTLGGGVNYPRLALGTAGRIYALWTESVGPASRVVLCRGRLTP